MSGFVPPHAHMCLECAGADRSSSLEDAVLANCGHSFGGGGLKRLMETVRQTQALLSVVRWFGVEG